MTQGDHQTRKGGTHLGWGASDADIVASESSDMVSRGASEAEGEESALLSSESEDEGPEFGVGVLAEAPKRHQVGHDEGGRGLEFEVGSQLGEQGPPPTSEPASAQPDGPAVLEFDVGEQLGEQGPPPSSDGGGGAQEASVDGSTADAKWIPGSKRLHRQDTIHERLRPAYRSYVRWWLLILLGTSLLVMPWWPVAASSLTGIDPGAYLDAQRRTLLNMAFFGIGGIATAFGATVLTYRRLANRYYLTPYAITEETGLIARHVSRVQLEHIRTVDVRQSVVDRLLGTGSIHFASAGTGADDVTWRSVLRPVQTQHAVLEVVRRTREGDGRGVTD